MKILKGGIGHDRVFYPESVDLPYIVIHLTLLLHAKKATALFLSFEIVLDQ
jgi:hypothetical protein